MEKEESKEEDRPPPQSVVLSQTCWEYKTLLHKGITKPSGTILGKRRQEQHHHHSPHKRQTPDRGGSGRVPLTNNREVKTPTKKRAKADSLKSTPIASLRELRETGITQASPVKWDIFVLVLQTSGLQQITSRAGLDIYVCTLLVADPTSSFFKVTLWRRAAKVGAELIHAGDLVRLNRIGVSTFRGTVQANSSQDTSFRVVWRGDSFTTHHDVAKFTMLPHAQSSRDGSGRRYLPDLAFSEEDPLTVSRETGCDLAAWAKREFPSVTVTHADVYEVIQEGAAGQSISGSLGGVRKGTETTVRACVVQVTTVERLWTWESEKGKRRKDLVARATALLTDGHREMTLQLWGEKASEDTLTKLRAGVIVGRGAFSTETDTALSGEAGGPVVFEFVRLRPEFSFSCGALVLNMTGTGNFRILPSESPEAICVANAVARNNRATLGKLSVHLDSDVRMANVGAAWYAENESTWTRRFPSVAELVTDHGFSGVCLVEGVIVRKVGDPSLVGVLEGGKQLSSLPPVLHVFFGDPNESRESKTVSSKSSYDAVVCVSVNGSALSDLLGGIPWELLTSGGANVGTHGARFGVAATELAQSLVDGLVGGGKQRERFDVILACSATEDANGHMIPGGFRYRLVRFRVCS